MIVYTFLITLRSHNSGKAEEIWFDSTADDYLNAWKEACEAAWGYLNDHDKYWLIESIKHYV